MNPVCAVAASGDARPHRPSIKKGEKRGENEGARERERRRERKKGCIGVENENGVFPPLRPTLRAPHHASRSIVRLIHGERGGGGGGGMQRTYVLPCPTVTLLKLTPLAAARKVSAAQTLPTRVGRPSLSPLSSNLSSWSTRASSLRVRARRPRIEGRWW